MARKGTLSGGEVLGWSVAGLAAGLAGGVLLAAWVGLGGRRRVRRALNEWRPLPSPARNISTPARRTQEALNGSTLREHRIEVIGVMPGVVELHGWVPSRALRASAGRIAAQVPGIERVVNCILVRGEDNRTNPPRTVAGQSA